MDCTHLILMVMRGSPDLDLLSCLSKLEVKTYKDLLMQLLPAAFLHRSMSIFNDQSLFRPRATRLFYIRTDRKQLKIASLNFYWTFPNQGWVVSFFMLQARQHPVKIIIKMHRYLPKFINRNHKVKVENLLYKLNGMYWNTRPWIGVKISDVYNLVW